MRINGRWSANSVMAPANRSRDDCPWTSFTVQCKAAAQRITNLPATCREPSGWSLCRNGARAIFSACGPSMRIVPPASGRLLVARTCTSVPGQARQAIGRQGPFRGRLLSIGRRCHAELHLLDPRDRHNADCMTRAPRPPPPRTCSVDAATQLGQRRPPMSVGLGKHRQHVRLAGADHLHDQLDALDRRLRWLPRGFPAHRRRSLACRPAPRPASRAKTAGDLPGDRSIAATGSAPIPATR